MSQWGPFVAVTVVVLIVLLVLAHKSQQFLFEYGDPAITGSETATGPAVETSDTGIEATATDVEASDTGVPTEGGGDDTRHGVAQDPSFGDTTVAYPERHPAMELTPIMLLANVAFTQALVAIVLVAAAWYFSIPAWAFGIGTARLEGVIAVFGAGVLFGVILWAGNEVLTAVIDRLGISYDERVRQLLAPETRAGWLFLFLAVLPLIATTEEILFRAALIGVPYAGFGISPWVLAILSSVVFAFGHGAQGRVGIAVTGILGFALAAGYIISESLLLVVVAHYVINALEFLVHEYFGFDGL